MYQSPTGSNLVDSISERVVGDQPGIAPTSSHDFPRRGTLLSQRLPESPRGGIPKMLGYHGRSHENGWVRDTPISGKLYMKNTYRTPPQTVDMRSNYQVFAEWFYVYHTDEWCESWIQLQSQSQDLKWFESVNCDFLFFVFVDSVCVCG